MKTQAFQIPICGILLKWDVKKCLYPEMCILEKKKDFKIYELKLRKGQQCTQENR